MEVSKKFVVDPGNARGSNITEPEIDQAIHDILAWISSNIPSLVLPPPSPSEIPNASYTLSKLLTLHNGGIQMMESFKTLSIEAIHESIELGSVSIHWEAEYIPFAKNIEGDYLVLKGEEVLYWSIDIGVIEQTSPSLGLYLERLRNGMLSGKLEYIDEECGLIETVNEYRYGLVRVFLIKGPNADFKACW